MSVGACCPDLRNKSLECVEKCPKVAMITLLVVGILALALATFVFVSGYLPKSVALLPLAAGMLTIPIAGGALYVKRVSEISHQFIKLEERDYALLQQRMDTRNINFNELLEEIFTGSPHVTEIKERIGNRVFRHKMYPGILFKVGIDEDREARFQKIYDNMALGYKVCRVKKLDLLSIPAAALFHGTVEGKTYPIFMMGEGEASSDLDALRIFYLHETDHLLAALEQLKTFVELTGWNEIDWDTIPVLSNSLSEENFRILLLIGERMDSQGALYGYSITRELRGLPEAEVVSEKLNYRGILGCLPRSHHHFIESHPPTMQNPPTLDDVLQFLAEKKIWRGDEEIKPPYPVIQFSDEEINFYAALRSYLSEEIWARKYMDLSLRDKRKFEIDADAFPEYPFQVKQGVLQKMQEREVIGLLREEQGCFNFYA